MMQTLTQPILFHGEGDRAEWVGTAGWSVCLVSRKSPDKSTPNEDGALLFPKSGGGMVVAIADGCGGFASGELAARLVLESLACELDAHGIDDTRNAILDGIERANQAILDTKTGAGCTVVIADLGSDGARTYHVGDAAMLVTSRMGRIGFQSICHSPVGYAEAAGLLTPNQAILHVDRHLISNYVGHRQMRVEIGPRLPLRSKDRIVVASDGLFDNLRPQEIASRGSRGKLPEAMSRITRLADKRMRSEGDAIPSKPDDTTIALIERTPLERTQARGRSSLPQDCLLKMASC